MVRMTSRRPTTASRSAIVGLVATIVLASGLVGAGSVAAADSASDIPGIPLPGPVAAGRLGGAIYDAVYRIDVPAGFVIVASVTGTAGTDFDMYLFDSSATTVVATTGLLTKSVGRTSSESISWPSRFGGTYYIDLNGATDVEGDYRLTVQTIPDPTRPSASLTLAGGRSAFNLLSVPVAVAGTDDLSGVVAMALSVDGVTFGPWQPLDPTATWTFQPGDGPKRLWAKVQNGVGLESPVVSATVVIDTVPPQVIGSSPGPGARVAGLRPTLEVSFDEPIDPRSWLDLGLVVQASDGALVEGSYEYDPSSRTGTFTPAANLHAGALYVVTIGNVTDVAGNMVPSAGSWTLTPLTPTSLTTAARPSVVTYGGSATIDLGLNGAPLPAILDAAISSAGGAFVPQPSVSMDDGRNSVLVTPLANTTYRFTYPGTPSVASAQGELRVIVRRSVRMLGLDSGVVARATVGRSVPLVAVAGPPDAHLAVSFKLYRFDRTRRQWLYAGSKGRSTDSGGNATLSWVPTATGSYYWRASVGPTVDFANNITPVYRFTVGR